MNKIIKTALICAAAFSVICCGKKEEDPAVNAIKERIASSVGEGAVVKIYSCEKIDSTTYGEELEYRKGLFNTKLKKTQELYDKYTRKGMTNNAKKKAEELEKTKAIIAGLDVIEENIKDSLDVVAYYDYKISGRASNKVAEVEFPEYYASVSKDNEVLYIQSSQRGLHRTNGRVIPGYMALIKGESEESSAE